MVSPPIQKYRNLRNFPLGVEWLRYTKSKKEKPKQATHISSSKAPRCFYTYFYTFILLI